LLEKPSTSNVQDAEALFRHPLLSQPSDPPVLMEAFHSRFTPAWRIFQSTIDQRNVSHVLATAVVPSFIAKDDDIRFNYNIGGGALLDLGTYPVAALRGVFGAEPTECIDAQLIRMATPRDRCDHTFHARFSFPNGGVGEVDGTLRAPNMRFSLPTVTVTHKPVAAPEEEKEEGTKVTRTRKVIFYNFMFSPHYHRVDVIDEFEMIKGSPKFIKKFTREERKKAYTFKEMGGDQPSELYWSTYRHMLEQFVNKVKGREGSGVFISHEDSIAQARALDMIYEKSGLGPRPTVKLGHNTV
jgi:predicted dehydrogenase